MSKALPSPQPQDANELIEGKKYNYCTGCGNSESAMFFATAVPTYTYTCMCVCIPIRSGMDTETHILLVPLSLLALLPKVMNNEWLCFTVCYLMFR